MEFELEETSVTGGADNNRRIALRLPAANIIFQINKDEVPKDDSDKEVSGGKPHNDHTTHIVNDDWL